MESAKKEIKMEIEKELKSSMGSIMAKEKRSDVFKEAEIKLIIPEKK